ncbi:hydroxymethylglutaryl-CoA lyase [Alphaproteobacteria bacterium KMM 3653]|uniref:Hydroxymethylglutaryl-CoA lyase n=1 Tax=Harenicola maris TaxID=2841044 RepID=A0AAP2CRC9_9RHOB|nr:hydroxymethylglutaryl-CoA lyase [Harenicola maris]
MGETVRIVEVGPRDGLQNEPGVIAQADKLALISALAEAGVGVIEAGAFVHPRLVPQMADTGELLGQLPLREGLRYAVLVPNARGLEGFLEARRALDAAHQAATCEVAVFVAASEAFSQANTNCSVAEGLERAGAVVQAAKAEGLMVRGYVSCVVHCPYTGAVAPEAVADVSGALAQAGVYEVSLGDTIGRAQPVEVEAMLGAVLTVVPAGKLAGHFHDTGGQALENIGVSLDAGLRVFDASAGGLGGCPFAPGAAGNVATGAVVDFVQRRGFDTGIDGAALARASDIAQRLRSKPGG